MTPHALHYMNHYFIHDIKYYIGQYTKHNMQHGIINYMKQCINQYIETNMLHIALYCA